MIRKELNWNLEVITHEEKKKSKCRTILNKPSQKKRNRSPKRVCMRTDLFSITAIVARQNLSTSSSCGGNTRLAKELVFPNGRTPTISYESCSGQNGYDLPVHQQWNTKTTICTFPSLRGEGAMTDESPDVPLYRVCP